MTISATTGCMAGSRCFGFRRAVERLARFSRPDRRCSAWVLLLSLCPFWLGLAACAGVGPRVSPEASSDANAVPPPPSFHSVTAAPGTRPVEEILALRGLRSHAGARLRIAFLLQETGNWAGAETELQQIVFADPRPERDVEAIARWLRARGFERRGESDRARAERAAGLLVADEPGLRERLTDRAVVARPGPAPSSPVAALSVLPRTSWKAAAAKTRSMKPMGPVHRITIHHSATACRDGRQTAAVAAIRSIQRYHQEEQGWGDIGYHFLIDPAGRVWTGRAVDWQGAHAGDDERNQGNLGICLLGNFMPRDQGQPPAAQLAALDQLVKQLARRHEVAPRQIVTHHELKPSTDCPGPYLQTAVERLRGSLETSRIVAAARE